MSRVSKIVYHPGTGTFIDFDECKVVEVPEHYDAEMIEDYLRHYDLIDD
jgi:hypothetical protein